MKIFKPKIVTPKKTSSLNQTIDHFCFHVRDEIIKIKIENNNLIRSV